MPPGGIGEERKDIHDAMVNLRPGGLGSDGVADMVHRAILENRFYVLTTDAFDDGIRERFESILARRNPNFPDLLALSQKESAQRLKR